MKPIQVYTINRDSVLCNDIHQYHAHPLRHKAYYRCDPIYGVNPEVAVIDMQQWKIRRICEGLIEDDSPYTAKYFESYIAVDPVLEKMLVADVKEEYEQKLDNLHSKIKDQQEAIESLSENVRAFCCLPWYKRLYWTLKNPTDALFGMNWRRK